MFTKGCTQLQFLLNTSLRNTYMPSLVLECALEIPKCACRNAPLPTIGLTLVSQAIRIFPRGVHARGKVSVPPCMHTRNNTEIVLKKGWIHSRGCLESALTNIHHHHCYSSTLQCTHLQMNQLNLLFIQQIMRYGVHNTHIHGHLTTHPPTCAHTCVRVVCTGC